MGFNKWFIFGAIFGLIIPIFFIKGDFGWEEIGLFGHIITYPLIIAYFYITNYFGDGAIQLFSSSVIVYGLIFGVLGSLFGGEK